MSVPTCSNPDLPPLVVIAGPTAGGKSARALALAEARNGVIINADASQLYADLRIITARPDDAALARAPHRLYGALGVATRATAADWSAWAVAEVRAAWANGQTPIVVGGTGLYLETLWLGIAPVPPIDPQVRARVRAMPVAEAHAQLARDDPAAAARLSPGDTARVARALEVVWSTGRSLTAWQTERTGGLAGSATLTVEWLTPPRDELYARCDVRVLDMLAAGALAEADALLRLQLPAGSGPMAAIGVGPLSHHLSGYLTLEAAVALWQQQTRNYAKRQLTWARGRGRKALGDGATPP